MAVPSPCFVLDEARLVRNLELLNAVQERAGIKVILAFKGFAMWRVFPIVRQYLAGATASSLHEARLCEEEMGKKAHTYMVAYPPSQFEEVVRHSSHLTFNSLRQWQTFKDRVPMGISCGLRVNPGWSDVETDLYNPAGEHSRLGITAKDRPEHLPEGIEGLHFHVLCESDSHSLKKVLDHLERDFGPWLQQARWVNMGGGHLMTREGYDLDHLVKLLKTFKDRWGVEVILEPGSAVAWETGDLHATVLDIVESNGVNTAIADISFTCHMPDCLEMPYQPVIAGAYSDMTLGNFHYRIGGVSCLAGDFVGTYGFNQALQPGDQLIFEDMMHYTMVKTTTFNGIGHPSIGIRKTNGAFELIREFGYDDYKSRLS